MKSVRIHMKEIRRQKDSEEMLIRSIDFINVQSGHVQNHMVLRVH